MDLLRLELRIPWAIFPKFESTAEIESEWTSENPIQISQKYGRKGCYCYCLHGVLLSPQPAFIFLTGCFLDFLAFIGAASNPMKQRSVSISRVVVIFFRPPKNEKNIEKKQPYGFVRERRAGHQVFFMYMYMYMYIIMIHMAIFKPSEFGAMAKTWVPNGFRKPHRFFSLTSQKRKWSGNLDFSHCI